MDLDNPSTSSLEKNEGEFFIFCYYKTRSPSDLKGLTITKGVRNMMKKLLAGCLVLFIILPGVISCTSAKSADPLLVPVTAKTVIEIQVGKILNNPVLQLAYEGLAKAKTEQIRRRNHARCAQTDDLIVRRIERDVQRRQDVDSVVP